jgi:FkbM family methyltransferase
MTTRQGANDRNMRLQPGSTQMDRYWQEVGDFLTARGLVGRRKVAPIEFSPAITVDFGYANAGPSEASQAAVVVLHKGLYQELDRRFVGQAIRRLRPVFANEVFIVLAEEGQALPDGHPHLGHLPEIEAWAASGEESRGSTRRRMGATYIGNDTVLTETIQGQLIVLPAADRGITPHIIRDGYFDRGVTRFLERFLRPGMTYVDVGANIGVYVLLAAKSVGATGRVVAVEALPRLHAFLIDNLSMNGLLDRALILPFAAADKSGELTFHDFGRYTGSSTASPVIARQRERRFLDRPRTLTIPAKTLSILLREAEIQRADLIKIDVEGLEWEVLQGARDFLTGQRNIHLLLEWHPEHMSVERQALLYAALVDELGCRIEAVDGDGFTQPIDFDELQGVTHVDILARRELDAP